MSIHQEDDAIPSANASDSGDAGASRGVCASARDCRDRGTSITKKFHILENDNEHLVPVTTITLIEYGSATITTTTTKRVTTDHVVVEVKRRRM